jgi:hypothetical protein
MVCILLSVSVPGVLVAGAGCLGTLPAGLSADWFAVLVDDNAPISFAKGLENIFAFAILLLRLKSPDP